MKELIESKVLDSRPGALLIQGTFRAFAFPRHMHDGYSIGLIRRGVNRFQCGSAKWEARTGNICVVNPGEIHTGEADCEGWSYSNLFVQPETLSEALGYDSLDPPCFRDRVFTDTRAMQHFVNLTETCLSDSNSMAINCAYVLLLARLGQIANVPVKDKLASEVSISRVKDLLDSVCDRSLTLAELAAAADMNTFHLVHSFTAAFGISPYAYHLNQRLLHAQRMIVTGTSIPEVAFNTGFSDQAHFTRHFRRFLGVTPGRVAKLFTK